MVKCVQMVDYYNTNRIWECFSE